MAEAGERIARAVLIAALWPQAVLLARAMGWEAPPWAAGDRMYVAAVIRHRMLDRDASLAEVLFAPGQFAVAHLLDQDPPEMEVLVPLALEALQWGWEDLPARVDAFWSPVYLEEPPYWAGPEFACEVPVEGAVHRFYRLYKAAGSRDSD